MGPGGIRPGVLRTPRARRRSRVVDVWAESFPDLRWELDRILDAGNDLVVAFVRMAGRSDATGIDLETPSYAVVFTLRGRRSRGSMNTSDSQEALEAAGLSE